MMRDAALLFAFIEVESAFNPRAFVNDINGGSYGLTQIDLATAEDRGYKGSGAGLFIPCANIQWHCAIIDWITADLTKHGIYSIENLAAAYNSGLSHVINGGTDAPYSGKIVAAYARWREALGDTDGSSI